MPRRFRSSKTITKTGGVCEECHQRIVFVKMIDTGRSVPVDPIPVADGNVCARRSGKYLHGYVISKDRGPSAAFTRFAAHFGTCPDRERPALKPKLDPDALTLFDLEDR
jgi:hypothetical protein